MAQTTDKVFFRNYSIVIAILAVMIVIFLFLARMIGMDPTAHAAQRDKEVSGLTQPVGQVQVAGQEAAASGQSPAAAPAVATAMDTAGPAPAAAATDTAAPAGGEASSADVGKRVFSGLCFSCHGTGLPGIPQFGDKTAWAPRIAKGMDTLHDHALHGFSGESGMTMPAKGGNPALSDDEVMAAVDYMVSNSK